MQNKITINQAGINKLNQLLLDKVLIPAMQKGVLAAQDFAPVDTSSLQSDIRVQNIKLRSGNPSADLAVGGGDYRGQMMKTGQEGNLVDYAATQEAKHGFLEGGSYIAAEAIRRG